jgi:hypothetical protein
LTQQKLDSNVHSASDNYGGSPSEVIKKLQDELRED